jgi:hypothetical protein
VIDLHLPGEIYFVISQGHYEFKNKNGIADMISDSMSISRVSDFTEISSIMLNPNLKEHNSSQKKVRKLSINDVYQLPTSPEVRSN